MRLIKMIGLAAAAAMAAMAFVGPTSASAASTELCLNHTSLVCGSGATAVGFLGTATILNDIIPILCLHVVGTAALLALANPQQMHTTHILYVNCGTNSDHTNCQFSLPSLPLGNLNKTGLDAGILTNMDGTAEVTCENIDIFGIDIHCVYDLTGLEFSVGAQHLTANETKVDFVEGGELCPEESFLDGLLKTTANRYVLA